MVIAVLNHKADVKKVDDEFGYTVSRAQLETLIFFAGYTLGFK